MQGNQHYPMPECECAGESLGWDHHASCPLSGWNAPGSCSRCGYQLRPVSSSSEVHVVGARECQHIARLRNALVYVGSTAWAGEASPNRRDFRRIVNAARKALSRPAEEATP